MDKNNVFTEIIGILIVLIISWPLWKLVDLIFFVKFNTDDFQLLLIIVLCKILNFYLIQDNISIGV
jgi:hypothetical protein